MALECDIEDDCYFLGVHIRLSTQGSKIINLLIFSFFFLYEL